MSKLIFFKRYLLLIDKLRNRPSNFKDIKNYILENISELDKNIEKKKKALGYSMRTFERDKDDIFDLFGIEIQYDRNQKAYFINDEFTEDESVVRIVDAFSIYHAIKQNSKVSNSLFLEKRKPLGTEIINGLIHAIQNLLWIQFEHHKHWDIEVSQRMVKPIALKEAQHRWYLVAEDKKDNTVKTFGLDRIQKLIITNTHFKPVNFSVEKAFQHAFGIETDLPAVKVVLQFSWQQGNYVESFPLHHSQKLVLDNDDIKVFELFIHPTHDLRMELLRYGNQLTVLEPESLRIDLDEMK